MANGQRVDPFGNFNFLVEIDGITRAAFQEASGFDSSIDITEHREGGENTTMRKLPAMTKYSNITLKWGATDDRISMTGIGNGSPAIQRQPQEWLDRALGPRRARRRCAGISSNAWPAKWTGPSFNAEGNDVAIETLELAHEGLERA